jgi:hypothetical protein
MEDELRSEYDLKSMRIRKLGSGRQSFAGTNVQLAPDLAAMFPSAIAVTQPTLGIVYILCRIFFL